MADLEKILDEETRKEFLYEVLTRGRTEFKELYKTILKTSETNARHHMKILLEEQLLLKTKQKGSKAIVLEIIPEKLQPLRDYFGLEKKRAYFGLAGRNDPGKQVLDAITHLDSHGYRFQHVDIFTTVVNIEAMLESNEYDLIQELTSRIDTHKVELFDFERTREIIEKTLEKRIREFTIVSDVTGGTKVHTLAMYGLAVKYGLERIYIPETEKRITKLP